MTRKELKVLNNAIKWVSEKEERRHFYASWDTNFLAPEKGLQLSVRVCVGGFEYHTLPENFTGDIEHFICELAQNKLTAERDKLAQEMIDLQSKLDKIDCAEAE